MEKQHRKELMEQYKQMKTYMGVIQLKNTVNDKIYIAGVRNLKNKEFTLRAQLAQGCHMNAALQRDWQTFGGEAFVYEVLEKQADEDIEDKAWELKKLEKTWLEKLQPYGEKGYNRPPKNP